MKISLKVEIDLHQIFLNVSTDLMILRHKHGAGSIAKDKLNILLGRITGLGMRHVQYPAPLLSPSQIKKKEAWAGNEKPTLR